MFPLHFLCVQNICISKVMVYYGKQNNFHVVLYHFPVIPISDMAAKEALRNLSRCYYGGHVGVSGSLPSIRELQVDYSTISLVLHLFNPAKRR